jgi:hypothetical protein
MTTRRQSYPTTRWVKEFAGIDNVMALVICAFLRKRDLGNMHVLMQTQLMKGAMLDPKSWQLLGSPLPISCQNLKDKIRTSTKELLHEL